MFLLFKHKELCISDLELVLDFTQTKTSRHLNHLKTAGLLKNRRVDQWIFYSIKEEVSGIVEALFGYMDKDPELLADERTYQTLLSNRELASAKVRQRRFGKQK